MKKALPFIAGLFLLVLLGTRLWSHCGITHSGDIGAVVDSLDGVTVYYNGHWKNVHGRHLSNDGYNYGLKWQCVEFVKRYYDLHYQHRMPNAWGNARDFFHPQLPDGAMNEARGLAQFTNPSRWMPVKGDLIVFDRSTGNPFGHVAIISAVDSGRVEMIQQNPGAMASSREWMDLEQDSLGLWEIKADLCMGRLRKPD